MTAQDVYVASLGASTAIGRDAWSSAAAVRAKVAGLVRHPYIVDSVGLPMGVARAPWLEIEVEGTERFEALAAPAVEQCASALRQIEGAVRVGLCIALPAERPGLPTAIRRELQERLASRFPAMFTTVTSFPGGHAAGLHALGSARAQLVAGRCDASIVIGVDSYLAAETLEWVESCDQLHGAGPFNNAWGFVPGEGAGAVLLVSAEFASRSGIGTLARLVDVGVAHEPHRIKTETICLGHGLTQAFRAVLTALPEGQRISDVYCDMNGEPYRADEYGFAALRVAERFDSLSAFVTPAECWGDVGAASGPLLVAIATIAGAKGYAQGRHGCAWCSSEDGGRAAALIETGKGA